MNNRNFLSVAKVSCHASRALLLLATLLLLGITVVGQTGKTGTFILDGATHQLQEQGISYTDYELPSAGMLCLTARGADGGKAWIINTFGKTIRTGEGGQGATVSGCFKIGTADTELKPASKLRLIVGLKGTSRSNCRNCLGSPDAGGGGGTGIIYLPAGADEKKPSNWKILLAAGGGGGGSAGTGGSSSYWPGKPGQADEDGFRYDDFDKDNKLLQPDGPSGINLADYFGKNGFGGLNTHDSGAGGGTSYQTWKNFANGASWDDDYQPSGHHSNNVKGGYDTKLMGEPLDILCESDECIYAVGHGLFQYVDNVPMPIGGKGGQGQCKGGYGFGGGGGNGGYAGGGGGYSGGWPGYQLPARTDAMGGSYGGAAHPGGGGGGSYTNTDLALPGTCFKKQNGTTASPEDGFIDYQFSNSGPVSLNKGFGYPTSQAHYLLTNNGFTLAWQGDGNLVLYSSGKALWSTHTAGKGAGLYFQGDGNLVIRDSNGQSIWSSGTPDNWFGGKGGHQIQLSAIGALALVDVDGKVLKQWY